MAHRLVELVYDATVTTDVPVRPNPFLRWAGSKRKLLPKLLPYCCVGSGRYIEPFAGSAALFFALQPRKAILSDINRDLIQTLQTVRNRSRAVHRAASMFPRGRKSFERLRRIDPSHLSPIERAARFLFLNRFCFNGLYRTNLHGQFNVPYSPAGTGDLPSDEQLSLAARCLRKTTLLSGDFESVLLRVVRRDDFVYLDPPYAVGNRRVFRQYGARSFEIADLWRLRSVLNETHRRGARFLLSYADCPEARRAFTKWHVRRVMVQRNIAGFAKHRRRAAELLVSNQPL